MPGAPTQVRTYTGPDEYSTDVARAAAAGWFPVSQAWDGTTLSVTFEAGKQPTRKPISNLAKGVLIIVGAIVLLAVIASPRTSTNTAAPPRPASTARVYRKLDDRSWALLVKDPDAHKGEAITVWACITQFDAATGTGGFRGNASNVRPSGMFDGENAIFGGADAVLAPFVKDDVVSMTGTVVGTWEYDTTLGGKTTVPYFNVDSISRQGSCAI